MVKKCHLVLYPHFQVPKLKKSAVMISLVPDDVGKPTFKLEKVPVQNGTCLWENPIYVTVKLIREPKTGYIKEKIYHFIVSTVCCGIISIFSISLVPFPCPAVFVGNSNSCNSRRAPQNLAFLAKLQ